MPQCCDEITDPYCDDMPTSLARIYTIDGYVVGADGREYDKQSKASIADNFRKIFSAEHSDFRLLYSFSGTNKLTLHGSSETRDILAIAHDAIQRLNQRNAR